MQLSIKFSYFRFDSFCFRKAAKLATEQHPNQPAVVSPIWIADSWKQECLQNESEFTPLRRVILHLESKQVLQESRQSKRCSLTASSSPLFRGCIFSLFRISPPSWAVDFDPNLLESLIRVNGGSIASIRLLDVIQKDGFRIDVTGRKRRKCYVVCWGGKFPSTLIDCNPILSQIKRNNLCELIFVTPLWIRTCVVVQKRVDPYRMALLLTPQPWPMWRLQLPESAKSPLQICLTGFQGTEKAAITQLILAIGATYCENLSCTDTHLICRDESGSVKIEKATKWGLHVVSVEWLFHIIQYGYHGKERSIIGCEKLFYLREKSDQRGISISPKS